MQLTKIPSTTGSLNSSINRGNAYKAIVLSLVFVVIALTLIPIFYLLMRAFQKPVAEIWALLFRPKTLEVVLTTSLLVVAVVALTALVGILIATGLHFVKLPFRASF